MIPGSTIKMHMPRNAATSVKSEMMPRSKMQPCDQFHWLIMFPSDLLVLHLQMHHAILKSK